MQIHKIEVLKNSILRMTIEGQWFVKNIIMYRGIQLPFVKETFTPFRTYVSPKSDNIDASRENTTQTILHKNDKEHWKLAQDT